MRSSQPRRQCYKCAAIHFPTDRTLDFHFEINYPYLWKPGECEVCDFFMRFFERGIRQSIPEKPLSIKRASEFESNDSLGIVREALYEAVSTDALSLYKIEAAGETPCRLFIRFPIDLGLQIDMTPSRIEWQLVRDWIQSDTIAGPRFRTLERNTSLTVIDCHNRTLTRVNPGTHYVTLSYVWGSQPEALDPDCSIGTRLAVLPRTIEDSVIVCLELKFQYLWVDRYCIPQIDSEERHQLIQKMDEIYAQSTLTIVACAGEDPRHGLPGVTQPRDGLPGCFLEESFHFQTLPMVDDVHRSVWAERGWTYQEALLSQRRLYFTNSQLYFEGFQFVQCEWSGRVRSRAAEEVPWIFSESHFCRHPSQIYRCISDYAKRRLSYDSDAFNAILGIFAVFERRHQVRNIWGMPYMSTPDGHDTNTNLVRPLLGYSLCFKTEASSLRRKMFPSWSWLGWSGVPLWTFHNPRARDVYPCLEICPELDTGRVISWMEFESNCDDLAQFRNQLSRFIHIQAPMSSLARLTTRAPFAEDKLPFTPFGTLWSDWKQDDGDFLELIGGLRPADRRIMDDDLKSLIDLKKHIGHRSDQFLIIHLLSERYETSQHLLVEDHGSHWERVRLFDVWDRNVFSPETVRTIRLG